MSDRDHAPRPRRRPHRKPATMAQALNQALRDALADDPTVHVLGEDVGTLGGVFRITDGLTAEFGADRCTDTPLAEAGILGTAVGMAMYGLRPVVEMQFDAFAYPAFEQLISHVAKMRNRTRGALPLPITIRIPYGGGIGGVEHHSDSSEAYYAAHPRAARGHPGDRRGRLRAAARLDRLGRPGGLPGAQAALLVARPTGRRRPPPRWRRSGEAVVRRRGQLARR